MMMTWLIVLGEAVLILLIVLGVMAWRTLRKRARERAAVGTLVKSITDNQAARAEKLASRLKDSAHLDEADALAKAHELIKKQNRFYQDAIDLYFNRNNEVLSQLDHRLEDLMEQYHIFVSPAQPEANPGLPEVDKVALEKLSKEIAELTKNVEGLRGENAVLHQQLKATEQELDHLGREYMSAFNKDKSAKAEQRGLTDGAQAALLMDEDLEELFTSSSSTAMPATGLASSRNGDDEAPKDRQDADEQRPADPDNQDRGLLADLDLSELIGEDGTPKPNDGKPG